MRYGLHRLQRRIDRITPASWALVCIAAVIFTIIWSTYRANVAEDQAATASERADDKVASATGRITVLEEYVTLCREQPKTCREVVPPVEKIEPRVTRQTIVRQPTFAQVLAATRALVPAGIADYCRSARCVGGKGDPGERGAEGPVGATGPAGPTGADGAKGEPGEDAPTTTDITCTGMTPVTFTFTYSDGSQISVECEMLPPIEEEP